MIYDQLKQQYIRWLQDDTEASIISPVCLPWGSNDPGQRLREGDSFIVTGWGKVTNDNIETRISYTEYGTASRTLQVSISATTFVMVT